MTYEPKRRKPMRRSWNVDGLGCSNAAITYTSDGDDDFDLYEREECNRGRAAFIKRAYVAYWRSGGGEEPDANWSYTSFISNEAHIILANAHKILAVYRLLGGGKLNRLKGLPRCLELTNYVWPSTKTLH